MSDYDEMVRAELEQLSTEVIASRLKANYFTESASMLARQILFARGVESIDTETSSEATMQTPLRRKILTFVTQCLKGKESLSNAFWTLGGVVFLITATSALLIPLFGSEFFVVVLIVGSVGGMLHAVAVWRCAENTKVYAIGQAAKMYVMLQSVLPIILLGSTLWALISLGIKSLN